MNEQLSPEQFTAEMQKRWKIIYKHRPRRADSLHKRISVSSPLYCKSETAFHDVLMDILAAENNPQVFDFIESVGDWKEIRDLLNLAHASR